MKLHALGVAPQHQRQGIARHLLESALSVLRPDVLGVFGQCRIESPNAIRWYRAAADSPSPRTSRYTTLLMNMLRCS
ncbi:GNAT family N-acetyltransferase [Rhodococcus hoagii]|nr:GNAT family N-acetyltransferase [Prescottella equi]